MAGCFVEQKFPCDCLVPKNETGALNFLKKYPEYNGEGVTIAIFDSGVDPKAAGLQKLPDGTPKVIERFDCTGCGDVDTSKKVTASVDGTIIGLSGKTLKISNEMKSTNVSEDEYHIGLKSLYDLYPAKVKEKIMEDFKLKQFNEPHKKAVADISRQIDLFDATNNGNGSKESAILPLKEKLKKEDLDSSLEYLVNFEKKIGEIRTTLDCILYRTKNGWRAVIDTTEVGDLQNAMTLSEYSTAHDVQSLNDYISVSINVHDDGNVLEIVGLCSSHGTHVASIAAANHTPQNPELNGIAPAAKIVSLTIGDTRLMTEETGAGLVRAMIKVMELCNSGKRIHVINMSYGESAHWSNSGRVEELMAEVVNKYGVVWVAAAGNQGPGLSTIGSPTDGVEPCILGVGAYVSPEMMEAEYALRHKLPANVYTWTSRDPCIDGGQGVTVCAPGAAIASVPEMTLSKHQLMNGTSMASPHAAGAIAIIISGLLKNQIDYSPYSIKRALWNTATRSSYIDYFAQGNGLLNVEKAYEHLVQHKDETENEIRFSITVAAYKAKGIYIRDGNILQREYSVTINPIFCNDIEIPPARKLSFNKRLTLVSSVSWVQSGSFLDLSYSARTISVKVDPLALPVGVHAASIRCYDSGNIGKGTLFEIPVTVVIPTRVDVTKTRTVAIDTILYKSNLIQRHFIYVPNNATWAVLRLKSPDTDSSLPNKFMVHTVQLIPHRKCHTVESRKILSVSKENFTTHAFKCQDNNVLEVCIAKYWSCPSDCHLEASIEFRGISSVNQNTMHSANGIHRIDLTTLATEEIQPVVQLKSAVIVLKPAESKILPLTTRDIIPPGRQIYQNLLTYNLHLAKNQDVAIHVPMLHDVLYESAFESQFWMIFDANKMMVGCGDAFSCDSYIKLDKGDYIIRLQVRHEKRELLDKVTEATMLASIKLANPISMDFYLTYNKALINEKKNQSVHLRGGVAIPFYIAPLSNEKGIPNQCSWLDGTITYGKDDLGRKVDIQKFRYIMTEGPAAKKSNGVSKENKSKLDEYREGLRDFQIGMIPKLELDKAKEVYGAILEEFPDYLPAHTALIQKLDSPELKNQLPFSFMKSFTDKSVEWEKTVTNLKFLISLADIVIEKTDSNALLAYYGMKLDNRPDAAKIKTNMDKQKSTLLDAYVKKAISLSKVRLIESFLNKDNALADCLGELDSIYTEVGKFIDYMDLKVILFSLWHAFMHQQFGRMLKTLQKQYEDKLQRDILDELISVTDEKGWGHISTAVKKMVVSANPTAYRLF